ACGDVCLVLWLPVLLLLLLVLPRLTCSAPFPYTPLFRSPAIRCGAARTVLPLRRGDVAGRRRPAGGNGCCLRLRRVRTDHCRVSFEAGSGHPEAGLRPHRRRTQHGRRAMTGQDHPTACVLLIGNELLSGKTQDANLKFLATEMSKLGIR